MARQQCITWAEGATNAKGTSHTAIDPARCIDCGACLSVCPIEGAIIDAWRPELQGSPPGLPCLRCRDTVAPGRRFCQACGAPVATLVSYEDVRYDRRAPPGQRTVASHLRLLVARGAIMYTGTT